MSVRPGWARDNGDGWRWRLDSDDASRPPAVHVLAPADPAGDRVGPRPGFGFTRALRDVVAIAQSKAGQT